MKYNFVELLLKANEMRGSLVDVEIINKYKVELLDAYNWEHDLMDIFIDEIDIYDYEDQLNDYLEEIGEPLHYVMNDENLDDELRGEAPSDIIRMLDYGCFDYCDEYFSFNGYDLVSFNDLFEDVDEDDFKRWLVQKGCVGDDVTGAVENLEVLFDDLFELEEMFRDAFKKEQADEEPVELEGAKDVE